MENKTKQAEKISQSLTIKGLIIGLLTLVLLIPSLMIQSLISERQHRSRQVVEEINTKYGRAQTICGLILNIPYTTTVYNTKGDPTVTFGSLNVIPETLNITTKLYPEERHYGIYKTTVYKSEIELNGEFNMADLVGAISSNSAFFTNDASLRLGLSDLKGVTSNIELTINGKKLPVEASGSTHNALGKVLVAALGSENMLEQSSKLQFNCKVKLNGSNEISYIPLGKTTTVAVEGAWTSPGFTGSFSPEYTIDKDKGTFKADWSVLKFNRNIPDRWIDAESIYGFSETKFGVNLVNPVDHYQQNMRSAKYAIMFIALTFVVFFFVEILTRRRIHPIQYFLVGIALIIFYTLLLSFSEQLNFALSYFIASTATIALITLYAHSIFKSRTHTLVLALVLCALYIFLYVVLQLEDVALLIGSIGLFIILGVIMYISRKVSWYKPIEVEDEKADSSKSSSSSAALE